MSAEAASRFSTEWRIRPFRAGIPPGEFPYLSRTANKKAPGVAAKCLLFQPNLVGAIGLEPTTPTTTHWRPLHGNQDRQRRRTRQAARPSRSLLAATRRRQLPRRSKDDCRQRRQLGGACGGPGHRQEAYVRARPVHRVASACAVRRGIQGGAREVRALGAWRQRVAEHRAPGLRSLRGQPARKARREGGEGRAGPVRQLRSQ